MYSQVVMSLYKNKIIIIIIIKIGQNFDRPLFPKFEAPWVGDLPYMLKNCGGGP